MHKLNKVTMKANMCHISCNKRNTTIRCGSPFTHEVFLLQMNACVNAQFYLYVQMFVQIRPTVCCPANTSSRSKGHLVFISSKIRKYEINRANIVVFTPCVCAYIYIKENNGSKTEMNFIKDPLKFITRFVIKTQMAAK